MKKTIVVLLLYLVCTFIIFIMEESIRLERVADSNPLIVLKVKENNNTNSSKELIYYSLGFQLKKSYVLKEDSSDVYYVIGEEFYLFNKYMMWAWIS